MRVLAVAGSVLAAWACDLGGVGGGSGGVGAPCEVDSDCGDGLTCDEHGGKGSCQKPHGHGESESDSESASSTTTGTMTTAGPSSTTDPATNTTTDPDETDGETEDETGTGGETEDATGTGGETETETGDTEETSESGDPAVCEALCACMLLNCSSYEAYPYADNQACMDACTALDAPLVQCYGGFCEQASTEPNEGLAEHWCEHAWGELGADKC